VLGPHESVRFCATVDVPNSARTSTNQALRDHIAAVTVDDGAAMSGAISSDGIHGLEARPLLPSAQLATALPHPARISSR